MEHSYINQSLQLSFVGFSEIIYYLLNAQKHLDRKARFTRLNPHQDLSELAYAPPDPEAHTTSKEFDELVGQTPAQVFDLAALRLQFTDFLADAATPIPVLTNPDLHHLQVVDLRKLPFFQKILRAPKMGLHLLNQVFALVNHENKKEVEPSILNLLSATVKQELTDFLAHQLPKERAQTISALDGLYRLVHINLQLLAYSQAELYKHALIIEPIASLAHDWKVKVDTTIAWTQQTKTSYGLINFGYLGQDSRSFMSLETMREVLNVDLDDLQMFSFDREQQLQEVQAFNLNTFHHWQQLINKDYLALGANYILMHNNLGSSARCGRSASAYVLHLTPLVQKGQDLISQEVASTKAKSLDSESVELTTEQRRMINVQKALRFAQSSKGQHGELFAQQLNVNTPYQKAWQMLQSELSWQMLHANSMTYPLVNIIEPHVLGYNRPVLNYSQQIFIYNKAPALHVALYRPIQHNALNSFLQRSPKEINWTLTALTDLKDYNLEYRDDNFEESYFQLAPEVLEYTFSLKEVFKKIINSPSLKEEDYILFTTVHQQIAPEFYTNLNRFLTSAQAEPSFATPYEGSEQGEGTSVRGFANTAISSNDQQRRLSRKTRRLLEQQHSAKIAQQQDVTSLAARLDQTVERFGVVGLKLVTNDNQPAVAANVSSPLVEEDLNTATLDQENVSLLDLVKKVDAKQSAKEAIAKAEQEQTPVEDLGNLAQTAFLGRVLEQNVQQRQQRRQLTGIESTVPLIMASGYDNRQLFQLVNKSLIPSWNLNQVAYPQVRSNDFFSPPTCVNHAFQLTSYYTAQTQIAKDALGRSQTCRIYMLNQANVLTTCEREQLQHFLMAQKAHGGKTVIQFDRFVFIPEDLWESLKRDQHQLLVNAYIAKQRAQIQQTGDDTHTVHLTSDDFEKLTTSDLTELAEYLGMRHFVTPTASKVEAYLAEHFEHTNRKYGPYPYLLIKAPLNSCQGDQELLAQRKAAQAQGIRVVTAGQRLYYIPPDAIYGLQLLHYFNNIYHVRPYVEKELEKDTLESGAIIEEEIAYEALSVWLNYSKLYTNQVIYLQALISRNLFARRFGLPTNVISKKLIQLMEEHQLRGVEFTFDGYNRFSVLAGLTRPYEAFTMQAMQVDPVPIYEAKVATLEKQLGKELSAINREFQYLLAMQQAIVHWDMHPTFATGYRPPRVAARLIHEQLVRKYAQLQRANKQLITKVLTYYQEHQERRQEVILLDNVATMPQRYTLALQKGADSLDFAQIPSTWVISKSSLRRSSAIWQQPDWHIGKLLHLIAPHQRIGLVLQAPISRLALDVVAEKVQVFDQQYVTPSVEQLLHWSSAHNGFTLPKVSQATTTQASYVENIALAYERAQEKTDNLEEVTRSGFDPNSEQKLALNSLNAGHLGTKASDWDGHAEATCDEYETSKREFNTAVEARPLNMSFNQEGQVVPKPVDKATQAKANRGQGRGAWWKFGLFGDAIDEMDKPKETTLEATSSKETSSKETSSFINQSLPETPTTITPVRRFKIEQEVAAGAVAQDEVNRYTVSVVKANESKTASGLFNQVSPDFSDELIGEKVKPSFTRGGLHATVAQTAIRKLSINNQFILNNRTKTQEVSSNVDFGCKEVPSEAYATYLQELEKKRAIKQGKTPDDIEQEDLQQLTNLITSSVFAAYPRLEQQAADVGIVTNNRNTSQTIRQLKVKVINLDAEFDKWEKVLEQLTPSLVTSVQRIEGIPYYALTPTNISDHFAQNYFILNNSRFASEQEISIALAHRKALFSVLFDDSIDQNDFALICEDDIVFDVDWQARINRILQQATNAPIDAINLLHPSLSTQTIYPLTLHQNKLFTLSYWNYLISQDLPQLVEYPEFKPLASACYLVRKSAIARAVQAGVLDKVIANPSDLVNFLRIWPDRIRQAIPTLASFATPRTGMLQMNLEHYKRPAVYCVTQRQILWD